MNNMNGSMHICFLTNEYPPGKHGGVGIFTQTLGRSLTARGHRVTIIGFYPHERVGGENDQGVHIIRLPRSPIPKTGFIINGIRLRKRLLQIHQEFPIDIVEGPEQSLALLKRNFPVIKLIRMHGGHHYLSNAMGKRPQLWKRFLELRSFARCDYICAVSKFVAETTRNLLHLADQDIEIIPNPVDTQMFCPKPNITEEVGLILFVGTVYPIKGVQQLILAMPEIVKAVPNAHLWIVGSEWYDPETGNSFTEHLRNLISPGLKRHIIFKGAMKHHDLPKVLAKAQVCVYPSLMEAMPVAWLEGLAAGRAVVASETGPGPEIVEHGVSGLLCNPYEPRSIAEKVIQLLKSPSLRISLGGQARKRILQDFSLEVIVIHNEAFYNQCMRVRNGNQT